jgi:hypothetical protein
MVACKEGVHRSRPISCEYCVVVPPRRGAMSFGRRCMKNPMAAKTINIATTKPTAARMNGLRSVDVAALATT